jgi:PAS domain S-box-containing protein
MSRQEMPNTVLGNHHPPEARLDDADGLPAALNEREARYERLVENSPDMIFRWTTQPDVRIEYVNSAAERILGYPREKFLDGGLPFIQSILVDEEERDEAVEITAGRRLYGQRLRRFRRADGKVIWTETRMFPIHDDSGNLVAQEGTLRDVSDREDALVELRASEQQMRLLMEAIPDLILKLNDAGIFTEQVQTASRQPARHFLGKTIDELLPPESRVAGQSALQKALAGTSRVFRSRIAMYGDERSYEIRLVPSASGGLLALLRDVTDEEWVGGEEQRREARSQLEDTVDQMIGIRNPYHLTFREFAVLHLVARGAADKEIANELGIANSTVNKHVSNILGKMNAASRTEAGVRAVQEGLTSA